MINERQIQYLLTIEEEKNITGAAKKLFISQPALSRMIRDIEKEIGAELFVRDRGNLHLTHAGEVYLRGCRELKAIYHGTLREIQDLVDCTTGEIRLGVTTMTGEFLMPLVFTNFTKAYPGIHLKIEEDGLSRLVERTKEGELDLSFMYQTDDPALQYHRVMKDIIYVKIPEFYRKVHPEYTAGTKNPPLPPDELDNQPMILLKKGRNMRKISDQILKRFDLHPASLIETDNIHLAANMVNANQGFTFIPGISLIGSEVSGCYCTLKDYPVHRTLYLGSRKDQYLTKAESYLIENLHNWYA